MHNAPMVHVLLPIEFPSVQGGTFFWNCTATFDSFLPFLGGLMSTKVWLKRAAEVATGVGFRAAAEVSAEAVDTTDFKQKLQDADLIDVLVHGYLGIIFGEAGWPFPEVVKCNFMP